MSGEVRGSCIHKVKEQFLFIVVGLSGHSSVDNVVRELWVRVNQTFSF